MPLFPIPYSLFPPLELPAVLVDEGVDLVGHAEQRLPLLGIERDREAAEAVDAETALLRHLQRDAAFGASLQLLVLALQPFDLGLHLFGGWHALPPRRGRWAGRICNSIIAPCRSPAAATSLRPIDLAAVF